MGEMKNAYRILVRKPNHSEDLGIVGRIVSKQILGT
jgi:hypothetical protein